VVKSKKQGDLLDDLNETFDNLCNYKMMLNPKKCVFVVSFGKLHGIVPGDRYEPKEGGGHRTITATSNQERNLEADMHDGNTQSVHI
jgi:hypothetical protein